MSLESAQLPLDPGWNKSLDKFSGGDGVFLWQGKKKANHTSRANFFLSSIFSSSSQRMLSEPLVQGKGKKKTLKIVFLLKCVLIKEKWFVTQRLGQGGRGCRGERALGGKADLGVLTLCLYSKKDPTNMRGM